jgi:Arc/MetJ-type ribon-helix-helix transcriptional regulator
MSGGKLQIAPASTVLPPELPPRQAATPTRERLAAPFSRLPSPNPSARWLRLSARLHSLVVPSAPTDQSYGFLAPARRIPFWYHHGMSTQIAVRLPDDMVQFVDQLVERGRGSSRAAVIARALDRERRHEMAVQDAAIYAESGDDADMTDLVPFLSGHPVDPDQ